MDKAIATAVKTGKVLFGSNSTVKSVKTGRAKMVVLSSNCPEGIRRDIEYYCKLSNIPLITYKGSSLDLAAVCGKPFPLSALTIREPGDSEILKLTEKEESEELGGESG
ncbi:MAG: 50S ribosomal protein L30e [Nitrososphaerota archaeon]|nr:50S ribosomal protein L30e [Candidatus Bathyarchaeota archaeon]MDW8022680.1 50S ribosomal protein L30e [Nitrososphaerota archaeon]